MLYPPEQGTWGSGTATIIVTDSSYVMNRWAVSNSSGMPWVGFATLDLFGQYLGVDDTFHLPNIWTAVAGLEKSIDNSFIDVLHYKNNNQGKDQYSIIKYDSHGNIVFNNLDSNLYPYIYLKQVISLSDGSSISVGDIRPDSGSALHERYIVLIKSDSLGNQIWKKTYNTGNYIEDGESVALCSDGGFIIGGAELIISGPDRFFTPLLLKTDSNGVLQWHKKFGSTEYSNWPAYGVTQTQDGGFAFCGGIGLTDSNFVDEQMPWVVKLNSLGNMIWADTNIGGKTRDDHLSTYYRDIIELADGSLVVCGNQKLWLENKPDQDKHRWRGVIKKLSSTGTPQWVRYFHHPEINDHSGSAHVLYDIDVTPDGGFVAAGYATFTVDNVQSTWVVKVDSFGCLEPSCEVNSVPKIEPVITELKIYPNPANYLLNIDITASSLGSHEGKHLQNTFNFELYDLLGKQVLVQTLFSSENTVYIAHLPSGVYTYRIGETWGQLVIK